MVLPVLLLLLLGGHAARKMVDTTKAIIVLVAMYPLHPLQGTLKGVRPKGVIHPIITEELYPNIFF